MTLAGTLHPCSTPARVSSGLNPSSADLSSALGSTFLIDLIAGVSGSSGASSGSNPEY